MGETGKAGKVETNAKWGGWVERTAEEGDVRWGRICRAWEEVGYCEGVESGGEQVRGSRGVGGLGSKGGRVLGRWCRRGGG